MFMKSIKKKLIPMLMTMAMALMLSVTAFASGDGTGGGDPNSDLTFTGVYNTTINGQTATLGSQITNNGTISAGTRDIEILFNHNVSADYVKDSEHIEANKVYEYNCNLSRLKLHDDTANQDLNPAFRVGDGTPTASEKQSLFMENNFIANHQYTVTIEGYHEGGNLGIRCYNGGYLSTGDWTVTFTAQ